MGEGVAPGAAWGRIAGERFLGYPSQFFCLKTNYGGYKICRLKGAVGAMQIHAPSAF